MADYQPKPGDIVKKVKNGDCGPFLFGTLGVVRVCTDSSRPGKPCAATGMDETCKGSCCGCTDEWAPANSADLLTIKTPKMKNLIEKFRLLSKGEPEASFIKAGVQTMDGTLTPEGRGLWDAWSFEKNKELFNREVVQPILDADSKETK